MKVPTNWDDCIRFGRKNSLPPQPIASKFNIAMPEDSHTIANPATEMGDISESAIALARACEKNELVSAHLIMETMALQHTHTTTACDFIITWAKHLGFDKIVETAMQRKVSL